MYLAKDRMLDEVLVSLKVMNEEISKDEGSRNRFLREVKLTREVTHENVVRTFDVCMNGDELFFTMEYIEGKTLKDLIPENGLPLDKALDYLLQICHGLAAIHAKGIIHRDLKATNVIITKNEEVKIADFGIARQHRSNLTSSEEMLGTVTHMAPEMWSQGEITERTDIYSLGVVFYELVTGCLPFDVESCHQMMWLHLNQKPKPPTSINNMIPKALDSLILKMLEKNESSRPLSVAQIIEDLGSIMNISKDSIEQASSGANQGNLPPRINSRFYVVPFSDQPLLSRDAPLAVTQPPVSPASHTQATRSLSARPFSKPPQLSRGISKRKYETPTDSAFLGPIFAAAVSIGVMLFGLALVPNIAVFANTILFQQGSLVASIIQSIFLSITFCYALSAPAFFLHSLNHSTRESASIWNQSALQLGLIGGLGILLFICSPINWSYNILLILSNGLESGIATILPSGLIAINLLSYTTSGYHATASSNAGNILALTTIPILLFALMTSAMMAWRLRISTIARIVSSLVIATTSCCAAGVCRLVFSNYLKVTTNSFKIQTASGQYPLGYYEIAGMLVFWFVCYITTWIVSIALKENRQ